MALLTSGAALRGILCLGACVDWATVAVRVRAKRSVQRAELGCQFRAREACEKQDDDRARQRAGGSAERILISVITTH